MANASKGNKFKALTIKCRACGEIARLHKPRVFWVCSCKNSYADAGDGHYYRMGGDATGSFTMNSKDNKKIIHIKR